MFIFVKNQGIWEKNCWDWWKAKDWLQAALRKFWGQALPISPISSPGRSKPGYNLLRKILLSFPQINPDWLLLDDETMYRSDETPIREQPVSPDSFYGRIATSEQPSGSPCETDIAGNTDTVDAVDPHRIASGDFRNMTSSTVQRIIIVLFRRTFRKFTPKQE